MIDKVGWLCFNDARMSSFAKKSGIYFVGDFKKSGCVESFNDICKEIVYIGKSDNILSCVKTFYKCTTSINIGYSSGNRYRRVFIDDVLKKNKRWDVDNLYYSAVIFPEYIEKSFSKELASQYKNFFLLAYYKKWKRLPLLNKKLDKNPIL